MLEAASKIAGRQSKSRYEEAPVDSVVGVIPKPNSRRMETLSPIRRRWSKLGDRNVSRDAMREVGVNIFQSEKIQGKQYQWPIV